MSDIRYFIKKPGRKRRTFALVPYQEIDGQRKYLALAPALLKETSSINHQFTSGGITAEQATLLLQEIIRRETPKSSSALRASQLTRVNLDLFDRFWTEVYGVRYLEDPTSIRYDLIKAIKFIEPLSLQTATQAELQQRLASRRLRANVTRRATDRLNQILEYLNRGFRLNKPKPEMLDVQYLTKEEVLRVSAELPNTWRDLTLTLFSTGIRLGEAMAILPVDLQGNELLINKQITSKGKKKLPKREKVGRSLILEFGLPAVKRWSQETARERSGYYRALQRACKRASTKIISPHDLRHSHAIYLLSQGANLTQVALQLRNRIEVCQQYYTGFAHSEGTLDALKRTLKKV